MESQNKNDENPRTKNHLGLRARYSELNSHSNDLQGKFAEVESANTLWHVGFAEDQHDTCSPIVIQVTHLESLEQDTQRPQILISGEIHGDERVGPITALYTAQLLTWSASCEIQKDSKYCNILESYGINKMQRIWLTFLATRRHSIIIPTTNCLGYINNKREDAGVDPNRDFPYSRRNGHCMKSTTARIINAVFAFHLIQLVVTFHGGMEAIGYEWGSENHNRPRDASPDDHSNRDIAGALRAFAGTSAGGSGTSSGAHKKGSGGGLYPVGRINSIIYPVDGGMEDWVYAAGWDQVNVKHCDTDTDKAKDNKGILSTMKSKSQANIASTTTTTTISDVLLTKRLSELNDDEISSVAKLPAEGNRAVVFLVETSDDKKPAGKTLGLQLQLQLQLQITEVLNPISSNNGHIPRNVRLNLVAIDVSQPYICITDIQIRDSTSSSTSIDKQHVFVKWYVGGSFTVDNTWLEWQPLVVAVTSSDIEQLLYNNNDSTSGSSGSNWNKILSYLTTPTNKPHSTDTTTSSTATTSTTVRNRNKKRNLNSKPNVKTQTQTQSQRRTRTRRRRKLPISVSHNNGTDSSTTTSISTLSVSSSSSASSSAVSNVVLSGPSRWSVEDPFEIYNNNNNNNHYNHNDNDDNTTTSTTPSASKTTATTKTKSKAKSKAIFHASISPPPLPSNTGTITNTSPNKGGYYLLVVWAEVDSSWGVSNQGYPGMDTSTTGGTTGSSGTTGPQSHLSNARTNIFWKENKFGREISGRKQTDTSNTEEKVTKTDKTITPVGNNTNNNINIQYENNDRIKSSTNKNITADQSSNDNKSYNQSTNNIPVKDDKPFSNDASADTISNNKMKDLIHDRTSTPGVGESIVIFFAGISITGQ
eukprot:gene6251-12656_t